MTLWRDLVLAARSLARARAFSFICILSLGIGMAPVIAVPYGTRIFTTPPPDVQTDGLIEVVTTRRGPEGPASTWSYPDYLALDDADTGATLAGWASGATRVGLGPADDTRMPARTLFVSADYFDVIGIGPITGPGFGPAVQPEVLLSHAFWQRRLDGDPAVVGRTLWLDGVAHTVVGIAPESFDGHLGFMEAALFLPLEQHEAVRTSPTVHADRETRWVRIHGRLRAGVSVAQSSAAVAAVTTSLASQFPSTNASTAGTALPYQVLGALEGEDLNVVFAVWQGLAGLVLLVVCLNVSGMVQVRAAISERNLSIRQAIGATRRRLMQYLFAEALVLAAVAGALAALLLFNLPPLISWMADEPIPARWKAALGVDASMIAICIGACLATSLIFGWLPALRFSRPAIISSLKDEAGGGLRAGRVHRAATAVQVAIAVPLLVLSATSLERVRATAQAALGFDADRLYAAPLPAGRDADGLTAAELRMLRAELAAAPGVAAVTVADGLPLDFRYRMTTVAPSVAPGDAARDLAVHVTRVGDNYFETMGIRVIRGRSFAAADGPGATPVAIVSAPLAARLFPDAGPDAALGQTVTFAVGADPERPPLTLTIIGVTADFPTSQMSTDREQLLLPLAQHAGLAGDSVRVNDDLGGGAHLLVIARGEAGEATGTVTAALLEVVRTVDPDFELPRIVTGQSLRERSMNDFLTQSMVAAIGGGVVLLLAALGLYGVVGMMVATRTREMAVRVTLGASRARVIRMVLWDVCRLVAPGILVGLVLAVAAVRLNGGLLGVPLSRLEPVAYIVGPAVALLLAMLASLGPARRAASVEPMVAMRST